MTDKKLESAQNEQINLSDLLCCPFCGQQPVFSKYRQSDQWDILSCNNDSCPVKPRVEDFNKVDATKRWNTRRAT